eukprot:scaffold22641_cov206-Cylindrotheca_fusiformis.AAC.5
MKHHAKYEDGVYSLSGDNSSFMEAMKGIDKFAAMDLNRNRRNGMLITPPLEINGDESKRTEKRSNMTKRDQIRQSLSISRLPKPVFARSSSEMEEVKYCLDLASKEFKFEKKAIHRQSSGEMMAPTAPQHSVMLIDDETKLNLGKVHYQLAVLHGMGRFPDVVSVGPSETKADVAPHDAFSVLFHLAQAASLNSVAAFLALGRLHTGLGTAVSKLLDTVVPIDFDSAKDLFRRAMQSNLPPTTPKAAAGCLLYQIYLDERESQHYFEEEDGCGKNESVSDVTLVHLLEDVIKLLDESENEKAQASQPIMAGAGFREGDRVEGNYCLKGSFYPGSVESVSEDGKQIVTRYDDVGSTESLTLENIRHVFPTTASQTALGGPLSDEEALGSENSDEKCLTAKYELKAELAELKLRLESKESAATLFEEASTEAMAAGKTKKASEWSQKAELIVTSGVSILPA